MDVGGGGVDTRLMTFSATVGNFECGRLFSEVISWRRSWLQPQKLTFQKCQSLFSTAAVASMCAPGRRVPGSGVRPEARGALGSSVQRSFGPLWLPFLFRLCLDDSEPRSNLRGATSIFYLLGKGNRPIRCPIDWPES